MHKTGTFIASSTPFSEKDLGKNTVIYVNLIKKLSEPRWTAFYTDLKLSTEIVDKLRMISKRNLEPSLQDEDRYHIRDSDPIDPSENVDTNIE